MGRGKELTVEEQAKIEAYVGARLGRNKIACQLGRAAKTIGSYIKDPQKYKSKSRTGRPRKLTKNDFRKILRDAFERDNSANDLRALILNPEGQVYNLKSRFYQWYFTVSADKTSTVNNR